MVVQVFLHRDTVARGDGWQPVAGEDVSSYLLG